MNGQNSSSGKWALHPEDRWANVFASNFDDLIDVDVYY
jgi:hypothetical protein